MKIEELMRHVEGLGPHNKMVFTAHVKKIVAYARKLEKDKRRLDFISKHPRRVVYRRGVYKGQLEWIAKEREYARWSRHFDQRRAIDAAMRAKCP